MCTIPRKQRNEQATENNVMSYKPESSPYSVEILRVLQPMEGTAIHLRKDKKYKKKPIFHFLISFIVLNQESGCKFPKSRKFLLRLFL